MGSRLVRAIKNGSRSISVKDEPDNRLTRAVLLQISASLIIIGVAQDERRGRVGWIEALIMASGHKIREAGIVIGIEPGFSPQIAERGQVELAGGCCPWNRRVAQRNRSIPIISDG